jgi:hypothetical protein
MSLDKDAPRHSGSTAPMWWGICVGLAFLVAATISFTSDDTPREEMAYTVRR